MLEIRNVTKIYKSKRSKKTVTALDNISIIFPNKGLVTFMGESGCGKSTLMNILSGLDTATNGKVIYNGKDLQNFNKKAFDDYRRNEIGMVFQDDNLLYDLTVYENIILPLKFIGVSIQEEEIDRILEKMSIQNLKDRNINELSGGQRQRVAIARTLVKKPKVILADEPTGSLDEDNARIIFEILKDISKDVLVIIFTHDKTLANAYSNRIYKMSFGKIVDIVDLETIQGEGNLAREVSHKKGHPLLYLFKTGFSNLKIKISRLILIIILSSFAFSLFGVCFSTAGYTEADMFAKGAAKNNYFGSMTISKSAIYDYGKTRIGLDDDFIEKFQENFKIKLTKVFIMNGVYNDPRDYNHFLDESQDNFLLFHKSSFVAVLTKEDLDEFQYTLVGNMPINDYEIAISDYQYQSFAKMGYKYGDLEIPAAEVTKEKIIGQIIEQAGLKFQITGIFDTGFRIDEYESLLTKEESFLMNRFSQNSEGFNQVRLITEHTKQLLEQAPGLRTDYTGEVILPKNKTKVAEIYKYVQQQGVKNQYLYEIDYFGQEEIVSTTAVLLTIRWITGILAILFLIFAILLLYSYVNIIIKNREYDIGILRSIGANAVDTSIIFSSEVFVISMLNFIVSLIITGIAIAIINMKFMDMHQLFVAPYNFDYIVVFSLLGVCLLAGLLALILPIWRLNRKKIINLLK